MGANTLLRCVALGQATGLRSSWGLVGPVLTGAAGNRARLAATAGLAVETAADKHPSTPSRRSPLGLAPRLLFGGAGAFVLARRAGAAPLLPVAVGVAAAAAGAFAGTSWRSWAAERMPDAQAAVVEDVVAATLALTACRGTARPLAGVLPE